jgi:GNAT superfamily N-acetyltransferase
MTELLIRDAHERDRDAIRVVTLSAYEEYAAMIPALWEEYRHEILATLGDAKPVERIVAEQSGAMVGSVVLYPAGTVFSNRSGDSVTLQAPEIRLLAVVPPARGQGVGAALVEECIRRARRSDAAAITLHTTDMMAMAMGMYERRGFVRAPELDIHPAPEIVVKGYRLNLAR